MKLCIEEKIGLKYDLSGEENRKLGTHEGLGEKDGTHGFLLIGWSGL